MYIKELTNEEFDIFSKTYPLSSVYQTKEYALTMNKEGYSTVFLGLIDEDNVIAASLILIQNDTKFKYAYAPRGFLVDYSNIKLLETFTDLIKKYLNKLGVFAIKICPIIIRSVYNGKTDEKLKNQNFDKLFDNLLRMNYYHFGFNNNFEALKPRYEAIIDLRKPINNLFNNISKNYRTKIRSASLKGVEIFQGNNRLINNLYSLTKGKYPRNITYYENLYEYFNRENNVDLYCAKLNTRKYLQEIQREYNELDEFLTKYNEQLINNHNPKKIDKKLSLDIKYNKLKEELKEAIELLRNYENGILLASALVVKHSDTAYIMIDGYDPSYKKMNGKHVLIWELIQIYEKLGYKKLNLGGISNIKIDNKFKGLTEFKCNFGANIIEYVGDLELITNNALYFMYRRMNPIKKIFSKKQKNKEN